MKKNNPTRINIYDVRRSMYGIGGYYQMTDYQERLRISDITSVNLSEMYSALEICYGERVYLSTLFILDFLGFGTREELQEYAYTKLGIGSEKE